MTYPPNGGLTDEEASELKRLDNNVHLKNALRKVLVDNTAGVIFNLLNLLDGTCIPSLDDGSWTGVRLADEGSDTHGEPFIGELHDSFFEAYWEWKKIRGDKGWKLDNYEE